MFGGSLRQVREGGHPNSITSLLQCISTSYPDTYLLPTNSLEKVLHLGKPQDRTFRNPKRRRKSKLEIHKLIQGNYELQNANPLWMPEISLGIGSERAEYDDLMREWLYWYDENDNRYPTPYEQIELERQQTEQERQRANDADRLTELERQRADRLAAKLRDLGIDPD